MSILRGWKSIMAYCKINDIKTMKKYTRFFKMPIVKLFGIPHTTTELIDIWFEEMQKEAKKRLKSK